MGRAGEEFVVGFERRRLERAGRDDLARDVRWVSDVHGDGYGYDVQSFETDGQERLLEIKTTCGNERTPFWMTKRECDVAAERRDIYRVRRVFHFRNGGEDACEQLASRFASRPNQHRALRPYYSSGQGPSARRVCPAHGFRSPSDRFLSRCDDKERHAPRIHPHVKRGRMEATANG